MSRSVVPPEVFLDGQNEKKVGGGGYAEKLVKYVPAETLAFFLPINATLSNGRYDIAIGAVVLAGLVGTIGYLWLGVQREKKKDPVNFRPRKIHFYILAGVAFICWTIGTPTNVAGLLRIDAVIAGVILAGAVFLIPLADEILTEKLG